MSFNDVEFLQIRAYSDHPEVTSAAKVLLEHHFKDAVRKRNEDSLFRDAKKLIASLWLHPSDLFRFTTKTTYFTEENRKQVWLTNGVLKLFKLMREISWINDAIPAIPPFASSKSDGTGVAAIYAKSSKFRSLLEKLTVSDLDVNPDLTRLKLTVEIEDVPNLKAEKVLFIDHNKHSLDSHTRWVIGVLEAQWHILRTFEIKKSDGSHLPWADIFYHQSLRGKLLRVGRIYSHFCVYPKTDRLGITIDGESVGSLDLSQIHPTMLLAFEGLQSEEELMGEKAPEDAYSMPSFSNFTRQHNKTLINILFNSKSIDSASKAFINTHHWTDPITNELVIKTYKGKTRKKRQGEPIFQPNRKVETLKYIDAFKATHPAFADLVAADRPYDLQSLDSTIALRVIDILTQAGFPVLTVHDEFIVRQQDRKWLEMALVQAAKSVLNDIYDGEWRTVKVKWETLQGKVALNLQ
jgi:hypothetical protein